MDQSFVFGSAYGLDAIRSLEFTSPFLFFISVFLVLAFVLAGYRKKKGREVGLVDTEGLYKKAEKKAKRIDLIKNFMLILVISMLGILWAGPVSSETVVKTEEKVNYLRTTIFVVDTSGSMNKRMTYDDDERTGFQAVRDASINYLKNNNNNTRVGIIFFSDDVIEWRRPTRDIEGLIEDLKLVDLKHYEHSKEYDYPDWMLNQLKLVSRGTNTPPALYRAEQTIYELSLTEEIESASVILFSDLEDEEEELLKTLNDLSSNKIKVYVVSNGTQKKIEEISSYFEENDMVKFFSVEDPEDVKEAYEDISEIEAKPIRVLERYEEKSSTKTEAFIVLLLLSVLFVLMSETYGHTVKGGRR